MPEIPPPLPLPAAVVNRQVPHLPRVVVFQAVVDDDGVRPRPLPFAEAELKISAPGGEVGLRRHRERGQPRARCHARR